VTGDFLIQLSFIGVERSGKGALGGIRKDQKKGMRRGLAGAGQKWRKIDAETKLRQLSRFWQGPREEGQGGIFPLDRQQRICVEGWRESVLHILLALVYAGVCSALGCNGA